MKHEQKAGCLSLRNPHHRPDADGPASALASHTAMMKRSILGKEGKGGRGRGVIAPARGGGLLDALVREGAAWDAEGVFLER